jgi:serine/threonine-protein kinase
VSELPEATAPVPLAVGDIIDGRYRVDRVLGVGGMGVVVAARHVKLGERVALKLLHPRLLGSREAVERFQREARAAARIKSHHVARVTDVGELESGAPYMVMEYLQGIDLDAWLRDRGALSVAQAVTVVLQVCEALAEAHVLGIVHRDLKPANLFCVEHGDGHFTVKILDFGISKVMDPESDHKLTAVQSIMGSPIYMSPEQMQRKRNVDARSDIWSLGVILFELVTRRPPFEAESVAELAVQIATEPTPKLRERKTDAPEALEQVIVRCLEKEREARFQNVGELAMALSDLAPPAAQPSVERILATLGATDSGVMSSPSLDTSPRRISSMVETVMSTAPEEPPRRSRAGMIAAGLVGVVIVAVVATWGIGRSSASPSAASEAPAASSPSPPPAPSASVVSASDPPPASSTAPTSMPSPSRVPSKVRAATTPGRAAPAKASTPECDPSYYYDARGKKHFKPECYQ